MMAWFNRTGVVLLVVSAITARVSADEPPVKNPVKVEFYWGESQPIPGVTADKGVVWSETGDMLYLHKQPVLTNKDVVKVEISNAVFGTGDFAIEHFTAKFHLTAEARKRLSETCGPRGEKMLNAILEGQSYGHPFYLKSRDEKDFVPFAGMFTSKDLADRIAATFAKADAAPAAPQKPSINVELRWTEFKHIPGVTEDQGIPSGEDGTGLVYHHKQAVLTFEDVAEARMTEPFNFEINGKTTQMACVRLHFTEEAKQKLAKTGKPGTKQSLALLLDGRCTSSFFVDVADLSNFAQPVGCYEKAVAERMVAGFNAAIAAARPADKADNAFKSNAVKSKPSSSDANTDLPGGWRLRARPSMNHYRMGLDRQTFHGSKSAGLLESTAAEFQKNHYAWLVQSIDVRGYRGKRLRLSAFLKTEDVRQAAYLEANIPHLYSDSEDKFRQKPILQGSTDWQRYEVEFTVSGLEGTAEIECRVFLSGPGRVWVDDVSLQVIGNADEAAPSTKPTDSDAKPIHFEELANTDFERTQLDLDLSRMQGLWEIRLPPNPNGHRSLTRRTKQFAGHTLIVTDYIKDELWQQLTYEFDLERSGRVSLIALRSVEVTGGMAKGSRAPAGYSESIPYTVNRSELVEVRGLLDDSHGPPELERWQRVTK
jgi:hypothetical protein